MSLVTLVVGRYTYPRSSSALIGALTRHDVEGPPQSAGVDVVPAHVAGLPFFLRRRILLRHRRSHDDDVLDDERGGGPVPLSERDVETVVEIDGTRVAEV